MCKGPTEKGPDVERPLVKRCKLAEDGMVNQIQDGKMLEGKLDLVADAKGLHSDGVRR